MKTVRRWFKLVARWVLRKELEGMIQDAYGRGLDAGRQDTRGRDRELQFLIQKNTEYLMAVEAQNRLTEFLRAEYGPALATMKMPNATSEDCAIVLLRKSV